MGRTIIIVRIFGLSAYLVFFTGCSSHTAEVETKARAATRKSSSVGRDLPLDRLRALSLQTNVPTGELKFVAAKNELLPGFVYQNGSRGRHLMVEATGGGCAWLDLDRDGQWDLYLVQGGIPDEEPGANSPSDRVWRQLAGKFRDITETTGVQETGYGQGAAAGDFDNDGFDDLFISNVGRNTLLHNNGDGTFEDEGEWGGQTSRLWTTSAAWGDVDLDGDLDLYVCNYVDFDPFHPQICTNESGGQIQCAPNQVVPVPDELYLNGGAGRFEPAAESLGLSGPDNRALGVVIADFVGDMMPEIYVANDATANFMFSRRPDGNYEDIASHLGCALDANGLGQASMGIATGDYNNDGLMDLYVTHFEGECNTLYQNMGDFGFRDVTAEVQAVQSTLPWVAFGTVMEDFDQNGFEDIFVANGHIDDLGRKRVLEMPPQLLTFDGSVFRDVSAQAGGYFESRVVGRGCSQADFDDDGDLDIFVIHQNRAAEILVNESQRGHWVAFALIGKSSNRHGIGARIVVRQGAAMIMQQLAGGGSYCSSRQPRLVFGLGSSTVPCDVEIRWPSGTLQNLKEVNVDQKLIVSETDRHD
ncbi:MAG: CRTAC1 family protein [Planctomycetaceae bacterium]